MKIRNGSSFVVVRKMIRELKPQRLAAKPTSKKKNLIKNLKLIQGRGYGKLIKKKYTTTYTHFFLLVLS